MEDSITTINELMGKMVPFVGRTGVKVIEMTPRSVKARMPLEGNENHINIMYMGALCTLAEVPGGVLAGTCFDLNKYVPIIKEISLQFFRPAKSDVTLEATLSEDEIKRINDALASKGKTDFTLEGELKDESGDMVAKSKVIFNLGSINR
jgi:acyl-coenzyme A thioesterase PaaI-like protein